MVYKSFDGSNFLTSWANRLELPIGWVKSCMDQIIKRYVTFQQNLYKLMVSYL
jgi:hypothetical protein